jgi:hypothetical protein
VDAGGGVTAAYYGVGFAGVLKLLSVSFAVFVAQSFVERGKAVFAVIDASAGLFAALALAFVVVNPKICCGVLAAVGALVGASLAQPCGGALVLFAAGAPYHYRAGYFLAAGFSPAFCGGKYLYHFQLAYLGV